MDEERNDKKKIAKREKLIENKTGKIKKHTKYKDKK